MIDIIYTLVFCCRNEAALIVFTRFLFYTGVVFVSEFVSKKTWPGKQYQYICGRTDIQAAHMMGFHQPEGKCVLFINASWLNEPINSTLVPTSAASSHQGFTNAVLHYCQAFGWSFHQVVDWGWCEILASCWNNFCAGSEGKQVTAVIIRNLKT